MERRRTELSRRGIAADRLETNRNGEALMGKAWKCKGIAGQRLESPRRSPDEISLDMHWNSGEKQSLIGDAAEGRGVEPD